MNSGRSCFNGYNLKIWLVTLISYKTQLNVRNMFMQSSRLILFLKCVHFRSVSSGTKIFAKPLRRVENPDKHLGLSVFRKQLMAFAIDVFVKRTILDLQLGSEYVSAIQNFLWQTIQKNHVLLYFIVNPCKVIQESYTSMQELTPSVDLAIYLNKE